MTEHVGREKIRLLLEGALQETEKLEVLEHIASCDECAEIMAEMTMERFVAEPPEGFAERIAVRAAPRPVRHESFAVYCLRVVAAVAAALVLLFSGAFNKLADLDYSALGKKSADAAQSVGNVFEKLRNISFDFDSNNETEETDSEQSKK